MDRSAPSRVSAMSRPVLLERERELASLDELIRDAARGSARVALVEGLAGIGKTQLLGETRRRAAEAGLRVLGARGGELEREFAFGVVRQLFEPLLFGAAEREPLLAGAAAAARTVFDSVPQTHADEHGGDTSFAVLHGLFWLTVNLTADGPLVLAIDDLHWCDRPSLRFLAYLVRRLEGLPVLVAGSLRPSEPGVDTALLAEITGDPLTISLHPRPLTEIAVAELVHRRLGDEAEDAFAGACHAATHGNPLLLNELLKALESEGVRPDAEHVAVVSDLGPRAASRAVLLRLARLTAEAATVARALAVLGDGADVASIARLAGLEDAEVASALGALARAEIIGPEPPLGFVHPLVAAAVYRDVLPGQRELLHERAARLLAEAGAAVEQVAAHLLSIPPRADEWIVETLRNAASAALQKGAPESAVSYLARALAESPASEARPGLLLELGLAESLTNGPAAAEHLQEAYELMREPKARALAAWVLGQTLLFLGFREESAAVARRGSREVPPELPHLRQMLEALELMGLFFGVGVDDASRRLKAYRASPADSAGAKMLVAAAANAWAYTGGPADACAELALEALAGGELIVSSNALFSTTATIALALADREEAIDTLDEALADAHRRGSLFSAPGIKLWRGFTRLRRGELAEAEDDLSSAFDEFERWGFAPLIRYYCAAFLATAVLERGDVIAARRTLDRVDDPDFDATGVLFLLASRLELLVAEGNADEAVSTAEQIERDYSWIVNPAVAPWRSLKALALDRLGRTDEAIALARAELEDARRWGAPWALGRVLRVLGGLERDLEHLRQAVDVLAGSPARLEYAKALAALGTALRHARQPTEAREPLRHALELATACGAEGLAEHARSELYAAGARPRTTALQGVESLTASERRVAALAADGQTNRDIAQTLFVTPKTVEVHLSNVYRKLGIRSRRELAPTLSAS